MPAADRYATVLDPLRMRYARSPLPAWLADARVALLSLLPARWRALVEGDDQRLCLRRQGDEVELLAAAARGDTVLGRLPLDDETALDTARQRLDDSATPRWLLLPASLVLRRRLLLPVAAEARLREVLAFELDRQTPFSADQVSYQGRILARDANGQQLHVELLVLPRARLEAELQALGPMADGLAGVDVEEPDGRRLGLNLLPDADRDARMDPAARLNRILAVVAVACLLGTLLLTLHNRDARLDALRAQVEAANQEARQARQVRNQLEVSVQAANFLATTRAGRPTMVEALDELTRRIPDDTVLDKLAITGSNVVMVGQSRDAAGLVPLLQASRLVSEPALSGSVQADARGGADRFTLTLNLVQPTAPAPAATPTSTSTTEAADAPRP
ncbi:PilN domain-containing protein [Arenimonas sp. MALMAid1274]|uniref:PilN domain-containing protein n=1 Tax=Arenimonas sp. MALMAid1274 TaxID=3411630 RepID=UPI003BA33492